MDMDIRFGEWIEKYRTQILEAQPGESVVVGMRRCEDEDDEVGKSMRCVGARAVSGDGDEVIYYIQDFFKVLSRLRRAGIASNLTDDDSEFHVVATEEALEKNDKDAFRLAYHAYHHLREDAVQVYSGHYGGEESRCCRRDPQSWWPADEDIVCWHLRRVERGTGTE